MAEAFTLDSHINTICLPPIDFVPYQQDCIATGWGENAFETFPSGPSGRKSVILKKIFVGIVEFNECQRELQSTQLGSGFKLDPTFICAGGIAGVDACQVNVK